MLIRMPTLRVLVTFEEHFRSQSTPVVCSFFSYYYYNFRNMEENFSNLMLVTIDTMVTGKCAIGSVH